MKSEAVQLRALEPEDVDRTMGWHNDAALYNLLGGAFRFVSREAEREWLRARCGYSRHEVSLAICLAGSGEHIGNIYLRGIDWIARHGEVHCFIGAPGHRSKGYGTAAIRQLAAHAFKTLGLQRLYLHVLADNEPALRAYERCGFRREGVLRKHAFKGGQFKDVVVMGLCSGEMEAGA